MTKSFLNLPRRQAQRPVLVTFMATSLCLGLFGMFSSQLQAQTPTLAQSTGGQVFQSSQNVAQQLVGQWELREPSSGQVLTFIFAPDGKLYLLATPPNEPPQALEMGYQINTNAEPMHMDLISSGETAMTIFELTDDGQLRLELTDINPGNPRPTTFSPTAYLLPKTSSNTSLPPETQVMRF